MVPPSTPADYSDKAELDALHKLASMHLGLKLDKIQRKGSEMNFVAVKSINIIISRRVDSRTFFIHDAEYGINKKAGVFKGDDQKLKTVSYEILKTLGIPQKEVIQTDVLRETLQTASINPKTGAMKPEGLKAGQRLVRMSRQIEGIPVFSSSVTLGLTGEKRVGFLEAHWPVISPAVIREAHRLEYKLEHGWRPPEQKGAKVESVEAGVIHSAAAGVLMDIYPAIRVIYAPTKEGIGRKLVMHYDRHGKSVPMPREFDVPCQPQKKRGAVKVR